MSSRSTPWLKRVLIPFWVIQIVLEVAIVGFASTLIAATSGGYFPDSSQQSAGIVAIVIGLICLAMDITQIVLFARNRLTPLAYLVTNCVLSIIFTVELIGGIVVNARSIHSGIGTVPIIIEVIIFLMFIATLIYASVIYHRHRTSRQQNGTFHAGAAKDVEMNSSSARAGLTEPDYQPAPYLAQFDAPPQPAYVPYNSPQAYNPPEVVDRTQHAQDGQFRSIDRDFNRRLSHGAAAAGGLPASPLPTDTPAMSAAGEQRVFEMSTPSRQG